MWRLALGPLAGPDVDRGADQADLRPPLVDGDERLLRFLVVDGLAGEPRQRPELEEERAYLGGIGDRLTNGAGLEVHVGPGQAGGGVESLEQPAPEVVGEGEEPRVPSQLVARKKAPQQPDGDLERLHRHVLVEGGVRDDVGVVLLRLVLEAEQDQGVEGVDRRREERLAVPVPRCFRERPQLVVAPRVPLVAPPRVEELRLRLGGEGGPVERRGSGGRPRGKADGHEANGCEGGASGPAGERHLGVLHALHAISSPGGRPPSRAARAPAAGARWPLDTESCLVHITS